MVADCLQKTAAGHGLFDMLCEMHQQAKLSVSQRQEEAVARVPSSGAAITTLGLGLGKPPSTSAFTF